MNELNNLSKYFKNMVPGCLVARVQPKDNSRSSWVHHMHPTLDMFSFNDFVYEMSYWSSTNSLVRRALEADGFTDYLNNKVTFSICFKNPFGVPINKLDKDPSKPFIEQFDHLIKNGKIMHNVHLRSDLSIEYIHSYLFEDDDIDSYPSHSIKWNPDCIEKIPEEDECYVGDYMTDNGSIMNDKKIFFYGYKDLAATKSYSDSIWTDTQRFCVRVAYSVYSCSGDFLSGVSIYDLTRLRIDHKVPNNYVPSMKKTMHTEVVSDD
jgi:hypothetical protein